MYPVQYEADFNPEPNHPIRVDIAPRAEKQSRLKAFFRWILALPVLLVLSYGTSMLTFVNGFHARVFGYLAFLTDDYPPIGLERSNGRPAGEGAVANV